METPDQCEQYVVIERTFGDRATAYGPYDSKEAAEEAKHGMPFSRATEGFDVAALKPEHPYTRVR